jgi:hypothetical protein
MFVLHAAFCFAFCIFDSPSDRRDKGDARENPTRFSEIDGCPPHNAAFNRQMK